MDKISYEILKDIYKDDLKMIKLLKVCDYFVMDEIKNLLYCCWAVQKFYASPMERAFPSFGGYDSQKLRLK